MPSDADLPDPAHWAATLIASRQTVLPKRLSEPGPDAAARALILQAAAAAPDHDRLRPWRWIEVPRTHRDALGQAFEDALRERDPGASADACAQAREKAHRAPWLLLTVVRRATEGESIPDTERLVSTGAALQNMLLQATALGFASSLTSGKALDSAALRHLFALAPAEQAVCFVNIGQAPATPRPPAPRADPSTYFSVLGAGRA